MKKSIFFAATAAMLSMTSCATIVSTSTQKVKFASNPPQASIFINEVEVGKTPFEMKLERKREHHVMIKLDGYKTYETTLTKTFNPWYLGNIVFGGLIGLVVDPITGAIYNLSAKEVNAQLEQGTAFNYRKGDVYVAIMMKPDPTWTKIGQLEKN